MLRILAATVILTAATGNVAASSKAIVGQPAPVLSLTTADGERLDIASLRGKRVLIFMWASW